MGGSAASTKIWQNKNKGFFENLSKIFKILSKLAKIWGVSEKGRKFGVGSAKNLADLWVKIFFPIYNHSTNLFLILLILNKIKIFQYVLLFTLRQYLQEQ